VDRRLSSEHAGKLGIQAQTLGTALNLGAQADARDAMQVLGRGD
jgi:hypothetical protein